MLDYIETRPEVDPNRLGCLGPHIDASKTLMFVAAFDRVVPRWTGEQLRQAIGNPKTIYLFSGYYTALLYLP